MKNFLKDFLEICLSVLSMFKIPKGIPFTDEKT